MKEMKILRIRELVLIGAFCISLWGSLPALAGQPSPSDWSRIERQVERLTEESGSGAIELEKRLSSIEYQQREIAGQIAIVTKLGLAIMASVTGLIIQAFWGLIVRRQKASD